MTENLQLLAAALAQNGENPPPLSMLVGLDGFVDEIIHMVDQRFDFQNYSRIPTLDALGARIQNAAGHSTNLEMVPQQQKLGGNGPILSNALLAMGVRLSYVGALGHPTPHPVFAEMAANAHRVYLTSNPGQSLCLEFDDGKLILGKHSTLKDITWARFKEVVGPPEHIAALIAQMDLFGMENWTMLPHMGEIWQGLIDEVFPLLPDWEATGRPAPFAFFDLADPEKRTPEDIRHALAQIAAFGQKFRVALGLNEKELYEIAHVLGIQDKTAPRGDLNMPVQAVYQRLGIFCLVVHSPQRACCWLDNTFAHVDSLFCAKPKLKTGAGDNFNAGFCLGLALGFPAHLVLTLGVCTAGYYVRHAHSPSYAQVLQFVHDGLANKI